MLQKTRVEENHYTEKKYRPLLPILFTDEPKVSQSILFPTTLSLHSTEARAKDFQKFKW